MTTKIIFDAVEDALFLGQNIFGHDFIHDFNVVNMKDRLSKISAEINRLTGAAGGMPRRAAAVAADEKLANGTFEDVDDPEDEDDDDYEDDEDEDDEDEDDEDEDDEDEDEDRVLDEEEVTDYAEMGEGETVDNLRDVTIPDIRPIADVDAFYNGRTKTRGLVKLVQHIKDLIYYSKLYIIGYFNSVRSTGSIADAFSGSHGGRHQNLHDKPTDLLEMKDGPLLKHRVPIKVKHEAKRKTSSQKFHQSFYECVRNGFNNAIYEAGRNAPEMKPYFECMKKMYLFFENKNTHPFLSFNNPIIEDAMFVYIHDSSLFDTDENIHKILHFFKSKYAMPHRGGGKIVGGALITEAALTAFRDTIQGECEPLFNFIKDGTPLTDPNTIALFANAERYKTKITTFEHVNPPVDKLNKLVKQLKSRLGPKHSVLVSNKRNYERAKERGRNVDQELVRFSHALVDFIITYIYEMVNTHLVTEENALNRRMADDGPLSSVHEALVQKVSSTVAHGVITYIGKGVGPRRETNEMLNVQHAILNDIANNKNIGSADKNLLLSFKRFATTTAPTKVISQAEVASKIRTKNKLIRVIDNAAPPETFTNLNVVQGKVFCPNSSMVDAMGSFGSCVGASQTKREKFSMNFMLCEPREIDAYIGQSNYDEGTKKLKIMYYANFNEFILPHVEMNVDMNTSKAIAVLSANNTFKSVINKILGIWMSKTGLGSAIPGSDIFWGFLRHKAIFSELVSAGSLKSVGDLYQEINATAKNGAYVDPTDAVTKSYRIGLMGDRPSGVRSGFILLKAKNDGKHDNAIAGYFDGNGSNTCAIIYEKPARGGNKTQKRSKRNKKQSRKLRK